MPPPRRQRLDVEERRQSILERAGALFAEQTYAEVSVAQVARASGASPALVFHYFDNKAGLYTALVERTVEDLLARQHAADTALPEGSSTRDRVRTSLLVYLDHIAEHPKAWASPLMGGAEPPKASELRRQARTDYVGRLEALLHPTGGVRHHFALWGYFGFVDAACLDWVLRGCDPDERHPLVDAALGALEGALGDWG